MQSLYLTSTLRTIAGLDTSVCIAFNRLNRWNVVRKLFSLVSHLGDGLIWFALAVMLIIFEGVSASQTISNMALTGLISLSTCSLIKFVMGRPRPFVSENQVVLGVSPLDQYSFPSGHTMHAVAFTVIVVFHYPLLATVLIPFTVLLALSRMILGLHYPSDVLAGSLFGAVVAFGTLGV